MAADGWRELARSLPRLMLGAGNMESHRLTELAISRLDARVLAVRGIRLRTAPAANDDDFADAEVFPTATLEDARAEIDRVMAVHAKAGHLASLCFEHYGIDPDQGPRFRQEGSHASVCRCAWEALKRIRTAGSSATASRDAVTLALASSKGGPLFQAWIMAAERLLNDATNEVRNALHFLTEMKRDVDDEFRDAVRLCTFIAVEIPGKAAQDLPKLDVAERLEFHKPFKCVPALLLQAGRTAEARGLVGHARHCLSAWQDMMLAGDFRDGELTLEHARRKISRTIALQGLAGTLCSLSFDPIGLDANNERRWWIEEYDRVVPEDAFQAVDKVFAIAACATAAQDAITLASEQAEGTALRTMWHIEANQLLVDGVDNASAALQLLKTMEEEMRRQLKDVIGLWVLIVAGLVP